MKLIQSVPIWNNGTIKSAEILACKVISDDLKQTAVFYYRLLTTDFQELATGNAVMTGTDYDGYVSNEYAWTWIGTTLGLTIIGDYIPPSDNMVAKGEI